MKILDIVFENLNSLAGRWEIDLTAPDFRDGVFLISGETGAGKTTILDAVALALFGETPRVDVSKAHNEAMTRGAGFCEAQVVFECPDGVFRATWNQRRAGEKAKIPFGPLKRALEKREGTSWTGLPGTSSELLEKTMKLVGAESFDQFLRTAMLAQGKFDEFLAAKNAKDDKARSDILEQATGTEIYSRIGNAIHRRWSEARDKKDELFQTQQGALGVLLSDDDRAEKEAERDRRREEGEELSAEVSALEEESRWHGDRKALEVEKADLDGRAATLKADQDAFAPADAMAKKAREARALEPLRSRATAAETAAKNAAETAVQRAEALEKAEETLKKRGEEDKIAQDGVAEAKGKQTRMQAPIAEAAELDTKAAGLVPTVAAAEETKKKDAEAVSDAKKRLEDGESYAEAEENKADECKRKREAPSPELDAAKASMEKAEGALEEKRTEKQGVDTEYANRSQDLREAVKEAEADYLEAETAKTYEEKRKELHDGKPCPLCGATEHPYCAGLVPRPDKFKRRLEEAKEKLAGLENRKSAAQTAFDEADKAFREAEKTYRELDETTRKESNRLATEEATHRANAEAKRSLMDETREKLPGLEQAARKSEDEWKTRKTELDEVRRERSALGLDDDLDALRKRLQDAVDEAVGKAAKAASALSSAKASRESAADEKAKADETAATRAETARKERAVFEDALREGGYADEAAWTDACWNEEDLLAAEARRTELKTAADGLAALRKAHEEKRAEFEKRTPSARDAEAVDAERIAKTAERDAARDAFVALETELGNDAEKRRDIGRMAKRVEELAAVAGEWEVLDKELGGENGKNFRLYAQGITLAQLVESGNKYLGPMTNGRYEMSWDPEGGDAERLLPTLVDRRAGGEKRPVYNLSGGERFQVSLSLALGLSDLNAGSLRVETLFLDEGFGTLDEKALDVAIATLENVQRDDSKTIGIISHVKGLDDRLTAKIVARKKGNGQSELSGPCVRRLPPTPKPAKAKAAAD